MPSKKPTGVAFREDLLIEVDRLARFLNISRSELIGRILEATVPSLIRRDVTSVTFMSKELFEAWGRE